MVFAGLVIALVKMFQMLLKRSASATPRLRRPVTTNWRKRCEIAEAPRASAQLSAVAPAKLFSEEEATLDSISWEHFELLMAEIFRRKGYAVEITSGLGADGGKDFMLRKDGKVSLVQCKKLAIDNRVTATKMRDFFGLITAEAASTGFFVTTGYFSADAEKFASGKPIELVERADVELLIREVSLSGENLCNVASWINTFAASTNIVHPLCPFCDEPMRLRTGALGRPFWGCIRYASHRCKGKRDARSDLLQALGFGRC
jgi:restriction system protein